MPRAALRSPPLVASLLMLAALAACREPSTAPLAPNEASLAQDTLGGACLVKLFWHGVEYAEESLNNQDLLGDLGDDWRFHAEATLNGETFQSDFPVPADPPFTLAQGQSLTVNERLAERTFEEGAQITVTGAGEATEIDRPPDSGALDDGSVILKGPEEGGFNVTKLEFECVEEGEEFIEVAMAVVRHPPRGRIPRRDFGVRPDEAARRGARTAAKPITDDIDETALVVFTYRVTWAVFF